MKLNLIVFLVLCFFIVSCVDLFSPNGFLTAEGQSVMVTLNFEGIVIASEDDSPIQGAKVELLSNAEKISTVETDNEGRYSIHYDGTVVIHYVLLQAYSDDYYVVTESINNLTDAVQVINFQLTKYE